MRRRFLAVVVVLMAVTFSPLSAMADDASPPKVYDGRLEGYGRLVTLDSGGTALSYFLLVGLGIIGLGGMFKNSLRTHLD